jgi:iron complex outermembrane receptor protein
MGPDQTLVLINGKRRHQTAFVALFGTRGRGNSGTDLNAFPQSSIDRIEILRDGASAQYGSDAMAGVMNLVLKKDVNKWSVTTGWSGYYDDKYNAYKTRSTNQYYYSKPIDGGTFTFSANTGFKLGDQGGFFNVSMDYLTQGKTYRQVADTNVSSKKDALPLNTSRRAFGDGSVTTIGAMYNMEIPLQNKNISFYSFGGINNKASDAFAYTRNYSARPERFPADLQGNLIFDADIMKQTNDGEIYYNPHIQTKINDISMATGLKGKNSKGWNWDLSNTVGKNDFHYYGDKTYNASMFMIPGAAIQTRFDNGGFNFLQNTFNFDMNKNFSRVAKGLNIAFGAEFRHEEYRIYKGEEASYKNYHPAPLPYANGDTLSPASGAQGFPGFSPADEVFAKRNNVSVYADAEIKLTDALLVDAAVRGENYSDFGPVLTYKIASRYKITPQFNLRGSFSTGFRAPSLQQINFSNTLTSFYAGVLVQSRIARNSDAITKAAGIEKLKEETSMNSSLGFAWKAAKGLTITIDAYMIKVKDRIVLSGLFDKDDNTLPAALTNELNALGVQTAQFFSNSVNTTNTGIDILVDYQRKIGKNNLKLTLAGNIQKMKVDAVNIPVGLNDSYRHRKTFFSDREEAMLLASAPNNKFNMSADYMFGKWTLGGHINYFGRMKTLGFGWTGLASQAGTEGPGDPSISGSFTGIDPYVDIDGYSDGVNVLKEEFIYRGKVTVDLYASYRIGKRITWFIGCDNLLNAHPDFAAVQRARYQSFDNESGGAWEPVQMGFNGRRLFSKIAFNF